MFKYLMLWVSLMLALPSYADVIFDGGVRAFSCFAGDEPIRAIWDDNPIITEVGSMNLRYNTVEINGGIDNPVLKKTIVTNNPGECARLIGFGLGYMYTDTTQVGTFEITRPWLTGEYFDLGYGLGMKMLAGDNPSQLTALTSANPVVTTFSTVNESGIKNLGLALQVSLRVMGDYSSGPTVQTVEVGTFSYTLTRPDGRKQIVTAPVTVTLNVVQDYVRSCTLQQPEFDSFDLQPAQKNFLDAGWEVVGGSITLGPVVYPPQVDVKVSFFDNDPNAVPESNYLRTMYSDDSTPSQYALKLYPTGSGVPLRFLPVGQLKTGWNAAANATTIDFTEQTTTGSSVQKDYAVKYVKVGGTGSDRPGPIKGLMTVQFLYY